MVPIGDSLYEIVTALSDEMSHLIRDLKLKRPFLHDEKLPQIFIDSEGRLETIPTLETRNVNFINTSMHVVNNTKAYEEAHRELRAVDTPDEIIDEWLATIVETYKVWLDGERLQPFPETFPFVFIPEEEEKRAPPMRMRTGEQTIYCLSADIPSAKIPLFAVHKFFILLLMHMLNHMLEEDLKRQGDEQPIYFAYTVSQQAKIHFFLSV